jgi:SAM-dependent methyltransferase
MNQNEPEFLIRSRHVSYFQQHGQVFAYHNLFGYLLAMSPDLVDILEFHNGEVQTSDEVMARFCDDFEPGQLEEFLFIFRLYSCLVESEFEEKKSLWSMVPVRSRWVVYHQPTQDQLTLWRTDRDGNSTADAAPPWAARLWAEIDGETTLGDLVNRLADDPSFSKLEDAESQVLETLSEWAHYTRQYLKMAKGPVSQFGPEHKWPSYLRSTMPYAPWDPIHDSLSENPLESLATPIAPPHNYYETQINDAAYQFENVETTLSHLLRHPSPLLGGATFADRVVDALKQRGHLNADTRSIVEVGGGLGHLAAGVLTRLRDDDPDAFANISYKIVDMSPALRQAQEARLQEHGVADRVTWHMGNAEELDLPAESVDLLLSNEVIGDFTTVRLTREVVGLTEESDHSAAFESWSLETEQLLGKAGELLKGYDIPIRDAPEEFYFNVGAIGFIATVYELLKPGGSAFISEYGDPTRYPTPSTHLDHIEFSIHFGHLMHVGRTLGFEVDYDYLQDLIGINRNVETLATTRTYYRSLKAMLESFDIEFDKKAYTRQSMTELLSERLPLQHIGDVRFQPVDERCMGLAPHEFKALMLKKP